MARSSSPRKAIVKNRTEVETLGSTSAINTDKTGTLTMNEMMVSTICTGGAWFAVEGEGYPKTGAITSVAWTEVPAEPSATVRWGSPSAATSGRTVAAIIGPSEESGPSTRIRDGPKNGLAGLPEVQQPHGEHDCPQKLHRVDIDPVEAGFDIDDLARVLQRTLRAAPVIRVVHHPFRVYAQRLDELRVPLAPSCRS